MTNLQSPYPSLRTIPEKDRHSVSQLKLRLVPGSDNRPQSVQEKKIQTETLPGGFASRAAAPRGRENSLGAVKAFDLLGGHANRARPFPALRGT